MQDKYFLFYCMLTGLAGLFLRYFIYYRNGTNNKFYYKATFVVLLIGVGLYFLHLQNVI